MLDSVDIPRPPETKPKIENLLPPGYPKYLFHGTSNGNLAQIVRLGFSTGTCTSNLFDSTNTRYSRKDGCVVVIPFSSSDFHNAGPDGINPNHYYTVKAIQPERIEFSYDHVDTDGVPLEDRNYTTDVYITPNKIGAFRLDRQQQNYLSLIADLLSGSSPYRYIRDVDPTKIEVIKKLIIQHGLDTDDSTFPAETLHIQGDISEEGVLDWNIYQRQLYAAQCLGLTPEDFRTIESLRQALSPHCQNDASFIQYALQSFPGRVEWISTPPQISNIDLLSQIALQTHQLDIVGQTEALLDGEVSSYNPLFPDSDSMQYFNQLKNGLTRHLPTSPSISSVPTEQETESLPKISHPFDINDILD